MCNLYSITTNQAAIINLFRVTNRSLATCRCFPHRSHIKHQPTALRTRSFGLTAANNGLVQRASMRWSDIGLFTEVLQLGFETLVDQEERL